MADRRDREGDGIHDEQARDEHARRGDDEGDGHPGEDRPGEDESRLLSLASRIDANLPIDWDAEQSQARTDEERRILAEMRLLARAAELFRDPDASAGAATSAGSTGVGAGTTPGVNAMAPRVAAADSRAVMPRVASSDVSYRDAADRDRVDGDTRSAVLTRWGTLTVGEPIGHGAFGTVHRAQDNLSREVALKLFPAPRDAHANDDHATRLLREGRLLARVRHPNVVTVFGVDRHDGRVGLWMERIHGRTLEDELRTRGAFSAEEAALIGRDLCRALAAVHAAGLLHRDVKAQNVMREHGGRIVLMDFGAGSDQRAATSSPGSGSGSGAGSGPGLPSGSPVVDVAGTPLYLAPEVFEGLPASEASDIYSLGVLLYHLVTQAYPIDGRTRSEIRRAHRQGQRTRLRDARPDLPDGFVQVVERAIAADPGRRYETAGELEDALSQACALPQPTPTPAPPGAADRDRDRGHHATSTSSSTSPDVPRGAGTGSGFKGSLLLVAAAIAIALIAAVLVAQVAFKPPVTASANNDAVTPAATSAAAASTAPSTPAASAMIDGSYGVKATFYKDVNGREVDLSTGDRVAVGDNLGLRVEASAPVYVYVANQDERGEAFLLFPLPAQTLTNPLQPGRAHHLPGPQASGEDRWQVTSSGEQEHFVVMTSPTPVAEIKAVMDALPPAQAGGPATAIRLAPDLRLPSSSASELVGRTRGIGGLARSRPQTGGQGLRDLFAMADALPKERETVRGLWVRTITLENPARRPVEQPAQR